MLEAYIHSPAHSILDAIKEARAKHLDEDYLDNFLAGHFGKTMVKPLKSAHEEEEGRSIESHWDAANAATAYARRLTNDDTRVQMEREAGKILKLAA